MSEVYGFILRNKLNPRQSPTKIWRKRHHLLAHVNINKSRYYTNIDDWEIVELTPATSGTPLVDIIPPKKLMEVLSG